MIDLQITLPLLANWQSSMNRIICAFIFLLLANESRCQSFYKLIGDTTYSNYFKGVLRTPRGYLLNGSSYIPPAPTLKPSFYELDSAGNYLWGKWYTYTSILKPSFTAALVHTSGDYYFFGTCENLSLYKSILIARSDPDGNILWSKKLDIPVYNYEKTVAKAVLGGPNEIYILTTYGGWAGTGPPAETVVYRLDSTGNEIWNTGISTMQWNYSEVPQTMVLGSDHNLYILGYQESFIFGSRVYSCLWKVTPSGNREWVREFNTHLVHGPMEDLLLLPNGNLLLGGYGLRAPNDIQCIVLAEVDVDGNLVWSKNYSRPGKNLFAWQLGLDTQNRIVVTGNMTDSSASTTGLGFFRMTTGLNGIMQSASLSPGNFRNYYPVANWDHDGSLMTMLLRDTFLIGDFWALIRTDSLLHVCDSYADTSFTTIPEIMDVDSHFVNTVTRNPSLVNVTGSQSTVLNFYHDGCMGLLNVPESPRPAAWLYPNPAETTVILHLPVISEGGHLILFDVTGKVVSILNREKGSTECLMNVTGLAPGLYFIKAGQYVLKLIKK